MYVNCLDESVCRRYTRTCTAEFTYTWLCVAFALKIHAFVLDSRITLYNILQFNSHDTLSCSVWHMHCNAPRLSQSWHDVCACGVFARKKNTEQRLSTIHAAIRSRWHTHSKLLSPIWTKTYIDTCVTQNATYNKFFEIVFMICCVKHRFPFGEIFYFFTVIVVHISKVRHCRRKALPSVNVCIW